MNITDTIIVTGAAGFIGSYLVGFLNQQGYNKLILVDDFSDERKFRNLEGKVYSQKIDRNAFDKWLVDNHNDVSYIFHLGARTDTTEMDYEIHKKLNLEYSQMVWKHCTEFGIPLLYASSAATYGGGEHGYNDDHAIVKDLEPLNPYGRSKNEFDIWALQQPTTPPFWAGVKFFNVFGPNEYHKGRMASVVFHAYRQIKQDKKVKLFASHNPQYGNGEQMRDFIYVKDAVDICYWLMQNQPASGLYNVGTGKARTFIDLARAIFNTLGIPENIEFIDTPEDIRDKYQYYTEANMKKLTDAGYSKQLYSLEESISEYITQFLSKDAYF